MNRYQQLAYLSPLLSIFLFTAFTAANPTIVHGDTDSLGSQPQLVSPEPDTTLVWPIGDKGWTFTWKPAPDLPQAKLYEIWVGTKGSQTPVLSWLSSKSTETFRTAQQKPTAGAVNWVWKVRAYLGMGKNGPWSEERSLVVTGVPTEAQTPSEASPVLPSTAPPSRLPTSNTWREQMSDNEGNRVEVTSSIAPDGTYRRRELISFRNGGRGTAEVTVKPGGDYVRIEIISSSRGTMLSRFVTTGTADGSYLRKGDKIVNGRRIHSESEVAAPGRQLTGSNGQIVQKSLDQLRQYPLPCSHRTGVIINAEETIGRCVAGDVFKRVGGVWLPTK